MDYIQIILTLLAIGVNIIAVVLVLKQIRLSIDAQNKNTLIRQISTLGSLHDVMEVLVHITMWKEQLQKTQKLIHTSLTGEMPEELKRRAQRKNNVDKREDLVDIVYGSERHKLFPQWLLEIYISGARYFYDSTANYSQLLKDKVYAEDLANTRLQDSIEALTELESFLKDSYPEVILETPYSDNNSFYFRKS